ncbi:MAG: hypothetical protein LBS48_02390, partial [Treponema sp.]|nr:hypothetical protein [Treponema sp.]
LTAHGSPYNLSHAQRVKYLVPNPLLFYRDKPQVCPIPPKVSTGESKVLTNGSEVLTNELKVLTVGSKFQLPEPVSKPALGKKAPGAGLFRLLYRELRAYACYFFMEENIKRLVSAAARLEMGCFLAMVLLLALGGNGGYV